MPAESAWTLEAPLTGDRLNPFAEQRMPGLVAGDRDAGRPQRRGNVRTRRRVFLEQLARHGDPALAADGVGLSLMALYERREADPVFAARWQAALGCARERVEARVLAALLAQLEERPREGAASRPAGRTGQIDSRLALAILNGRERAGDRGGQRAGERMPDSASVEKIRAEVRALAGLARYQEAD